MNDKVAANGPVVDELAVKKIEREIKSLGRSFVEEYLVLVDKLMVARQETIPNHAGEPERYQKFVKDTFNCLANSVLPLVSDYFEDVTGFSVEVSARYARSTPSGKKNDE